MRAAEEILKSLGYSESEPISSLAYLTQLVKYVQRETLIETIEISHEQGILGYPEFIEPQLKKLLDQIK